MSLFYAKPAGGYAINSAAGINNIHAIYDQLHNAGYSKDAITGICGNIYGESALNPWLWENNTVNYNNGYGLFQFTPASEYINDTAIPNHAPNLSTSQQTPGADPDDAIGQILALITDRYAKWVGYCWRSYWSPTDYPALYDRRRYCLDTYGNGSTITMNQFKGVTDYADACFIFLACYEGPAVPNFTTRLSYCNQIKPIIDAYDGTSPLLGVMSMGLETIKRRRRRL